MIAGRVDTEADDLAVAFFELRLEAGHVAELGRADRGEVLGMGKQNRPSIADPIVERDSAFRRLRSEIW